MRKSAIHHIVTLPLGYFSQNASGRLRNIIDDNAGLTEGFLAHQLPDLTGAAVMPVAVIILIFLFDWRLGICCLIPMGISVIFLKQMMGGDNAQFMGKYMTALETMNKEAVEYIRGIPVVKVFQQTIYSFKNFHAAIEEYEKFASGYALKCRIPLTGFTVTLNGTFVLLIPVAMFILSGVSGQAAYENVVLDFLFYSLFTPVCATMMNRIMFASEQLMAAKSAVSRVDEILQEKPLKEPEHPLIPADASIVFSDVSFAYPGTKEKALDHISFEVPTGKTVALVGASGSGKSTAASLIPRFYDVQSGSVTIGGVDVRNIEKQELMKRVAFVFQNTCLFKDTLLNNIKAARPDATREEVLKAADEAQCKDIIARLPDGLDTLVGTGGTYLSGGENQRIALARAILKDAPIIVLDEATAFADAENEHQIQLAFERLTQNKTVMMIAHRLSTIQDADLILVFKEGQIAERGTHTSLFTYILFLIAASRLYDPLSGAMSNMAELFSVQLQVNRLKEIEEYPEETGEKNIHTNGYDITFDHVQFSYEKGKPVLRDVSFTAKQGQVTALVGPSGGGKSTVAKLAAKFYPLDGGRILLGGTDIAPLNSTMLMKNFSIVFQDVVLFNNTIMENIRVGKKDATDEEVIAAAKAAQCDEFISKLSDGYQTVIGENGSTLSGGEAQRLSIARALLKDAPVILLDEATASLDVDNETEIQNAISRLVKGKTVLIIAHRMRTVEAADNIVVLSDGIVAENGTHEELMKENGLYHRLVDLQTASANWKLSV